MRIVGLRVAGQDRIDIVGAHFLVLVERQRVENEPGKAALVFERLGEQSHVGRRLAEGRRRGLIVGERIGRRKIVRGRARPLEDFALVVRLVVDDLIARRQRLDLSQAEVGTAGIAERAEGNAQPVAVAAHLLVDLEPALQLRLIVRAEQAREAPALPRRVRLFGLVLGQRDRAAHRQQREAGGNEKAKSSNGIMVGFPWEWPPINSRPTARSPRPSSPGRRRRSRRASAWSSRSSPATAERRRGRRNSRT